MRRNYTDINAKQSRKLYKIMNFVDFLKVRQLLEMRSNTLDGSKNQTVNDVNSTFVVYLLNVEYSYL